MRGTSGIGDLCVRWRDREISNPMADDRGKDRECGDYIDKYLQEIKGVGRRRRRDIVRLDLGIIKMLCFDLGGVQSRES